MTTTTSRFQRKPNYFPSKEECLRAEREPIQTNPRYKFFTQTHFTAGDVDQFEEFRDPSNGRTYTPVNLSENVFHPLVTPQQVDWEKYRNLSPLSVSNTFHYLFHKFKKGVFLKIKNGHLAVFLPFSKKNFTNEWSKIIQIDPRYGSLHSFLSVIQKREGWPFRPETVNKFTDTWYANNCLLRWEFPIHEGDTGLPSACDMFSTLAAERQLPDLEFFVNRRDFPLLTRDETEPYNHLFGKSTKLLSHLYNSYSPVLSMVGGDRFADIPIPTCDDWARVSRKDGKYFAKTATRDYHIKTPPWNTRKPIAVFRGASTGAGVTISTNPRLKAAYLSHTAPRDSDGLPLLDAGITEWNLRPRKLEGERYLQTIDIDKLPFALVSRLSPQQQAEYKYVVNIDGHVSAYRLSLELEAGFCVLLVDSPYRLWFRRLLKPYVHYVPVKADLSDLLSQIRWCKAHDEQCKQISENAVQFAQIYLSKNGILDYLQAVLVQLKGLSKPYFYLSPSLQELQIEFQSLVSKPTETPYKSTFVNLPETTDKRSYGFLKGVEGVLKRLNIPTETEIVFQSKTTTITKHIVENLVFLEKRGKSFGHEAFVGKYGTNLLLQEIPNFAYTFGAIGDALRLEYIEGETLYSYIHSERFNVAEYITILLQIGLALEVAQRRCEFVHYDLSPWNIVLKRVERTEVEYRIGDLFYRLETTCIPVMIDMERTHIVRDYRHYGTIAMFSFSSIQDILTLLSISLYEVSMRALKNLSGGLSTKPFLTVANFLSETGYRRLPFRESGKDGFGDLRYFFGKSKKYSELLSSEKYELEGKTPLQFVEYLNRSFSLPVTKYGTGRIVIQPSSALIRKLAFTERICDRADLYLKALRRFTAPTCRYDIEVYHYAQRQEAMLITVYRDALRYAERYAFSTSPFTETYKDTQKRLRTWHTETLRTTEAYPDSLPELANISYTETVFLFPEQVFNLLEKYKAVKSPVLVDKLNDVYNRREGSEYTLPSQLTERYRGIIHGSREFKRRYALWETLLQYANKAYIDEHKDSDEYLKMCLKIKMKISEFNAEKRKNEPIV